MTDLSSLPQADQDAIGRTLGALLTGFKTRDVDALQNVYAEDADWVNAFGTVKHSRDGILDHCVASSRTPTSTGASSLAPRRSASVC